MGGNKGGSWSAVWVNRITCNHPSCINPPLLPMWGLTVCILSSLCTCTPCLLILPLSAITQQIEHKLIKRGFQFNVIVVGSSCSFHLPTHLPCCIHLLSFPCSLGQTGLGKSTLVNTLFASHLVDSKGRLESDAPIRQTTEILADSHRPFPFFCTLQSHWLTRRLSFFLLFFSLFCFCFCFCFLFLFFPSKSSRRTGFV